MKYDYLIVGAGLFGASCARELTERGKKCLVVEKRGHPGGMAATEVRDGIVCQSHGGHIFHTADPRVWDWVRQFGEWRQYSHHVKVQHGDRMYSFPINYMTLQQVYGDGWRTAAEWLRNRPAQHLNGQSLKDWSVAQIGAELYGTFIKGYTAKQWGRDPSELPASIIRRIPVRQSWNDEYFDDPYQGLPVAGYTALAEEMLRGVPVAYGEDYLSRATYWARQAPRTIYSGPIDGLMGYVLGKLEYRSLRFEWERKEVPDWQGGPTVNYAEASVPWTRIHEHKHWYPADVPYTWVTREYPAAYDGENEPYYPLSDERNRRLYEEYRKYAAGYKPEVIVGGRLGRYQYWNMDQAVASALALVERETADA